MVRVTKKDLEALGVEAGQETPKKQPPPWARKNKYGAKRTEYNGVTYHSKSESEDAQRLDRMKTAGQIKFWMRQVEFRLGCPENRVVIDFVVVGPDDVWAREVKGSDTPKWRRDRKLWAKYGPCRLEVVRRGKVAEVIVPEGHDASSD